MTLLFLLNLFLVLSVVAMDGLMVQYARRESMKKRGAAQTMIYVTRQIGMVVGSLVKGFGLNWYDYSGPWCNGIDLTHIFLLTALVSCLAVPTVMFMTTEEKVHLFTLIWKKKKIIINFFSVHRRRFILSCLRFPVPFQTKTALNYALGHMLALSNFYIKSKLVIDCRRSVFYN